MPVSILHRRAGGQQGKLLVAQG